MTQKIAIIGGGAWGTALANTVAETQTNVVMWVYEESCCSEINTNHTNTRYIQGNINPKVKANGSLEAVLQDAQYIFLVLPTKFLKSYLEEIKKLNVPFQKNFIICTKGLEPDSHKFFLDIASTIFSEARLAILSGPNFAEEVMAKMPTITTIGTQDPIFYKEIESILRCSYFSTRYFEDTKAIQVCSLIKNVAAIVCGIAEGLGLGKDTTAAIITKGLNEMNSLCQKLGFNNEVILSPAGVGDLVLTCNSLKSRNMTFGYKIGCGEKTKDLLLGQTTVEGVANAKTLNAVFNSVGIQNTLTSLLIDVLENNYTRQDLQKEITKIIL